MRKIEMIGGVVAVVIAVICIPKILGSFTGGDATPDETPLTSVSSDTPVTSGTSTALDRVYINPPVLEAAPGTEFTINIDANLTANNIRGAELKLEFAPDALEILEVIPGESLGIQPLIGINQMDNEADTLHYVLAQRGTDQQSSSSNTIAVVRFKLSESANAGPYDLILTEINLVNTEFEIITGFEIHNGLIEVQ